MRIHRRVIAAAAVAATTFAVTAPADANTPMDGPRTPNVIVVLVDDMSENLYPYMSEVTALRKQGVTFVNYINATSFCCPSRATLQSGKFPHNTRVRTNGWPGGGFEKFMQRDMNTSIGVQMQAAGYRTGMMGKYLNGYRAEGQPAGRNPGYPANYVPPGWDSWFSGLGYPHFTYDMVVDESDDQNPPYTLQNDDLDPAHYYTDVLSQRAQEFVRDSSDQPFFLLVTPFAPHVGVSPDPEGSTIMFPAAPRDRSDRRNRPAEWGEPEFRGGDCGPVACADVPWPDTTHLENFNQVQPEPLGWMPTTPIAQQILDTTGRRNHLQRIQMLQSVNDMLRDIRTTLDETGKADDTYILFTSDNGYHIGEHALLAGKTTAYDHDVKTPLVITPPTGLDAPVMSEALVQNTDVLPTVLALAGAPIPSDVDGVSLLPLMTQPDLPWRDSTLIEMTNDGRSDERYFDPDLQGEEGRYQPPTFNALRTSEFLYVDYSVIDKRPPNDGQAEYYDLTVDPAEMNDLYSTLDAATRKSLNLELRRQTSCVALECQTLQGLDQAG